MSELKMSRYIASRENMLLGSLQIIVGYNSIFFKFNARLFKV